MRRQYSDIPLSIHAGEKDSPGHEVRDTLLLGATRIGHGFNLITDPDTMLLMRNNRYLVEINLVSNRLLSYAPDTALHPFPEYLRFGIPVCLNTDDRGSWDSNMTDEYYTAVTNFHLTWDEIVALGRNSLSYSFAEQPVKDKMLRDYDAAVNAFESKYDTTDWRETLKKVKPLLSGYAKRNLEPAMIKPTLLALVIAGALSVQPTSAQPIPVKVVVVAMFERGDDTGDAPGEYQLWVEREHLDQVFPSTGYHHVRMNKDGVLEC